MAAHCRHAAARRPRARLRWLWVLGTGVALTGCAEGDGADEAGSAPLTQPRCSLVNRLPADQHMVTSWRTAPSDALITHGNSCERKALRQLMNKGEIIVGDRYYGLDYRFLDELREPGVSFFSASATTRAWKSWRSYL